MRLRTLFFSIAASLIAVACSKSDVDDGVTPPNGFMSISISATMEGSAAKAGFVAGDCIGVYAVNHRGSSTEGLSTTGNQADNVKYSYAGGKWASTSPAYYRDEATAVKLIAYYPYTESLGSITSHKISFSDKASQGLYLMWGKVDRVEPARTPVTIQMRPLMACVELTVKQGAGWSDSEWQSAEKSVKLCNTLTEAEFSLAMGVLKPATTTKDITISAAGDCFTSAAIPQSVSASTRLFTVTINGDEYHYTLPERLDITAGMKHSFVMTIPKRGETPESEKLKGTIIGTRYSVDYANGQMSETVNAKDNLFDGNYDTFFASYDRSNTWVGYDLGEAHVITRIGYSPRITQPSRVELALIEGANKADFSDALPIYIIKESAPERVMSYADVTCSRGFRYVRYVTPNDKRCNLAELEFYGYKGAGDDSQLYQLTNLPTVVINTADAQDITSKEVEIMSTVHIISQGGMHILTDTETEVRGRGNASWNFEKKPYRLKFSEKRSPLGAPAEAKKWTLLSNHGDKTLMRNILAFEVSRRLGMEYTPFCKPVDVILNGEYKGCYQLCDQVDVRKHRVDVTEMKRSDNSGTNLTGGYLIEIDAYASTTEKVYFYSKRGTPVTIKSPDDDKITAEQRTYIEEYFNTLEASVFAGNYTDATNGYRKYLDLDSYLRHFLVGEYTGNTDTYWSVYMYKERGDDRFYVGPVWDCDLAFENDYRTYPINNTNDFLYCSKSSGASEAVNQMNNRIIKYDVAARAELQELWSWAKLNGLDANSMLNYVDETAKLLEESQQLNFKRWPILDQWVHMNFQALGSYEAEVGTIRTYIQQRVQKLDELINR